MMKIGTSGFRGIISDEFTKQNVEKIIQCICDLIKKDNLKKEVFVGYDNRFMSENFAKWICGVFVGNGINVKLSSSSVPSPLVSFATKRLENDFGIMVTASHNPYYYNGLKVYVKDGKEPDEELEKILNKKPEKIKKILKTSFDDGMREKKIIPISFEKEFINDILSFVDLKQNNHKVVFNVMNGSSLSSILELKKKLDLKNLEIYNYERDPLFNFYGPIPNEDNLIEFKSFVKENNFEMAFATDGDGDRIAVFDENGKYYNGNYIASLIYYYLKKEKKLKIPFIKNASFSSIIDLIAEKFGERVIETKVGFKHISKALIDNDGFIGAENSGCEIKDHCFVKDGIIIFAFLLEILSFYDKPLSKIFKDMENFAKYKMVYKEISLKVDNKERIVKKLKKVIPSFKKKIVKTGLLDGFKYIFDDTTWILIRFSGTEDLMRIVCEQNSNKEIDDLIKLIEDYIKR